MFDKASYGSSYQKARRDKRRKSGLCLDCGTTMPEKNRTRCKDCAEAARVRNQKWREAHPDAVKASKDRYRKNNTKKWRETHRKCQKNLRRKIRKEVIAAYGNVCNCCGESDTRFLTVDHVNGGGTKERSKGQGAAWLCRKVRREGFPTTYQILCWNCNCGRATYGTCPHKLKKEFDNESE